MIPGVELASTELEDGVIVSVIGIVMVDVTGIVLVMVDVTTELVEYVVRLVVPDVEMVEVPGQVVV